MLKFIFREVSGLWIRWRSTALNHPSICYCLFDEYIEISRCASCVFSVFDFPVCVRCDSTALPSITVLLCRVWLCRPSSLSPNVSGSPRASWLLWGPSAPGGCHECASPSGYCTHPLNRPQTKLILCASLYLHPSKATYFQTFTQTMSWPKETS